MRLKRQYLRCLPEQSMQKNTPRLTDAQSTCSKVGIKVGRKVGALSSASMPGFQDLCPASGLELCMLVPVSAYLFMLGSMRVSTFKAVHYTHTQACHQEGM